MNEFAATGMILAAEAGERIVVITPLPRAALNLFERSRFARNVMVRRAAGVCEVTTQTGGRISVISPRAEHARRGVHADVVYLDEGIDRSLNAKHMLELHDDLRRMTAPDGRVVRA